MHVSGISDKPLLNSWQQSLTVSLTGSRQPWGSTGLLYLNFSREFDLLTSWQRGKIGCLRFLVDALFDFIGCYVAGSSVTRSSIKITLIERMSSPVSWLELHVLRWGWEKAKAAKIRLSAAHCCYPEFPTLPPLCLRENSIPFREVGKCHYMALWFIYFLI